MTHVFISEKRSGGGGNHSHSLQNNKQQHHEKQIEEIGARKFLLKWHCVYDIVED